jgi:putative SOS response-associated peptidase YedK
MCDRYHLASNWRDDALMRRLGVPPSPEPPGTDRVECVRSTWAPILRNDDRDTLIPDQRRWGFHRHYPPAKHGAPPARRELFIADAQQVTRLPSFQAGFALRRCLVPMSAWSARPHGERKKALVEISLPERAVFAVAGLYETSQDIRTDLPVETFIILTTTPKAFLGSSKQAVPLVLADDDCLPWLNDGAAAHRLVRGIVDEDAYQARAAKPRADPTGLLGERREPAFRF